MKIFLTLIAICLGIIPQICFGQFTKVFEDAGHVIPGGVFESRATTANGTIFPATGISGFRAYEYDMFTSTEDLEFIENISEVYPNPFHTFTNIDFSVHSYEQVQLSVYNSMGNLLETLENGYLHAGDYVYEFSASHLPPGIYYYQIRIGEWSHTQKMILMR